MEKKINENRLVGIEIITPVRIGTPSDQLLQEGIDFFYREKILYYIDFDKLLHAVQEKGDSFSVISHNVATNNVRALEGYIFETLKIPIDSITSKKEPLKDRPNQEIYPFVRNGQGVPYIPGSSIKGAIRSVLFKYLYQDILNEEVTETVREWDAVKKRKVSKEKILTPNKYNSRKYEDKVLGKIQNNIMRFIRVGDTHFESENLETNFIDLFNLYSYQDGNYKGWESEWKDKVSITAQTLKPKSTASFRLGLAKPLVDILKNKYNERKQIPEHINYILTSNSFERLRGLINKHTRSYLESERAFFEEYNQVEEADFILAEIDELIQQTKAENSCLLRIGYGVGFHSITGDWRFLEDHLQTIDTPDRVNKGARYKSRRIVGNSLMGFVKLTF